MTLLAVMRVDLNYANHSHDCPRCNRRKECWLPMCHLVWIPLDGEAGPTLGEARLCKSCNDEMKPGFEILWPTAPHCNDCGSHLIVNAGQRVEHISAGKRPAPMPHDQWCYAELDL